MQALFFFPWLKDFIENVGRIVPMICWKLWCSRNLVVFKGTMHYVDTICAQVFFLLNRVYLLLVRIELSICNWLWSLSLGLGPLRELLLWTWMVVSSLTLVWGDRGRGFEGLIYDHHGNFLHSFYSSSGSSCIIHAKILTFFHRLQLCLYFGYTKVCIILKCSSCDLFC
jgi:hypothetical protein